MRAILLLGAAAALLPLCGCRTVFHVPLHLEEAGGVSRHAWPVSAGVPFPRGALRESARLALTDADGTSVPLQTATLARWPDGSVKWALLDLQADLDAGATARWRLSNTGRRAGGSPLAATGKDGVVVTTGRLRLHVPIGGAGTPLFHLWLDGDGDGAFAAAERLTPGADLRLRLQETAPGLPDRENWLRQAADDPGVVFLASADPDRHVVIEENGPLRAVVRIDGWHQDAAGRRAFMYTLRLHVFRGQSRIRFQHTFVATENVNRNFLRAMALVLPGVGAAPQAAVPGAEGVVRRQLTADGALSAAVIGPPKLYHLVSYRDVERPRYSVANRDGDAWRTVADGPTTRGWLRATGPAGAAAVAVRNFRQLHPKELRAEGSGALLAYLWADRGERCLDLRRRSQEVRADYVESDGFDPNGGRGIAKTHEIMVAYAPPTAAPLDASALAAALDEPVFPYTTPAYTTGTGVFGEVMPYAPERFPRCEASIAFGFRYLRAVREAYGMHGIIDWGDIAIAGVGSKDHRGASHPEGIPWRGYTGWCNSDFALTHGFFLHYLRTGDRRVLLDGEAMAMHVLDIDTEHYNPEKPESIGRGHRHDQQHWGNGYRDYCRAPHGAIDLYLLTGNRRAFDVAREMADNPGFYGRYVTLRFWEISGEQRYLDRAEALLADDLAPADRGWPFDIVVNFRTASYDNIGYQFYDAIRPSAALADAFVRAADHLRGRYTTVWMDKSYPPWAILALAHKYQPTAANLDLIRIALNQMRQGMVADAADVALPADADFAAILATNQRTLAIGRTDIFSLYYTATLPHALARLHAAGITESEALEYPWQWEDPPSFREAFTALSEKQNRGYHGFRQGPGKAWTYYTANHSPNYRINQRMPMAIQNRWRAAIGRHRLYEDGVEIGPHPYSAPSQAACGQVGWTRRLSGAVLFTTPDNSDPRTNGRRYELVYTAAADERWQDVPSFTETIDLQQARPYGKAWIVRSLRPYPHRVSLYPEPPADKARWQAALARQRLQINDRDLGPPREVSPSAFRTGAERGWLRWQNMIVFQMPEGWQPERSRDSAVLTYVNEADQ
jgi:hypothetical protein